MLQMGRNQIYGKVPPRVSVTDFPPELWQEVIPSMTIKDIYSLSRCSKLLRNFSIPYLFKTLIVHPDQQSSLQVPDHIARIVESVVILPQGITLSDVQNLSWGRISKGLTEVEVDPVLDALPAFPNLRELICFELDLSQKLAHQLVMLPLKQIQLPRCSVVGIHDWEMMVDVPGTLESIGISFYRSFTWLPKGRQSFCKTLMASPNLTSISMIWGQDFDLISAMPLIHPPPPLTNLDIRLGHMTTPIFADILRLCPSITSISIRCGHSFISYSGFELPAGLLPNLERYSGPADFLQCYTHNKLSIKHIHLTYANDTAHSDYYPLDLSDQIPPTVQSITCNLRSLYIFPLNYHRHFVSPSLNKVSIFTENQDFDALRRFLPSGDVPPNLSVRHFVYRAFVGLGDTTKSSVKELLPMLRKVYPNLEEARFILSDGSEGWECGMVWRQGGAFAGWWIITELFEEEMGLMLERRV